MILKPYTNKFDHEVVDCPFCDDFVYVQPCRKGQDPLRGLYRHIAVAAKREALQWFVNQKEEPGKHMVYYKDHARPKVILKEMKFDGDMKIK